MGRREEERDEKKKGEIRFLFPFEPCLRFSSAAFRFCSFSSDSRVRRREGDRPPGHFSATERDIYGRERVADGCCKPFSNHFGPIGEIDLTYMLRENGIHIDNEDFVLRVDYEKVMPVVGEVISELIIYVLDHEGRKMERPRLK